MENRVKKHDLCGGFKLMVLPIYHLPLSTIPSVTCVSRVHQKRIDTASTSEAGRGSGGQDDDSALMGPTDKAVLEVTH